MKLILGMTALVFAVLYFYEGTAPDDNIASDLQESLRQSGDFIYIEGPRTKIYRDALKWSKNNSDRLASINPQSLALAYHRDTVSEPLTDEEIYYCLIARKHWRVCHDSAVAQLKADGLEDAEFFYYSDCVDYDPTDYLCIEGLVRDFIEVDAKKSLSIITQHLLDKFSKSGEANSLAGEAFEKLGQVTLALKHYTLACKQGDFWACSLLKVK